MTGTIFDVQRFSTHDGPGIRTTVFMKGCPLRCAWCHNPEGLSPNPQLQFTKEECISCGRCKGHTLTQNCPTGALKQCGRRVETAELIDEVLQDKGYYSAGGGVTFSGGECLLQADFVAEMLRLCKKNDVSTAIDTSGCVTWEAFEKTMEQCDLYLYDIKAMNTKIHKQYTGMDNSLILQNLSKLSRAQKPVWLRVPIIPSVNNTQAEMEQIAQFITPMKNVQKVTLMPYHTLGKSKYETLGTACPYETKENIDTKQLALLQRVFVQVGIAVD